MIEVKDVAAIVCNCCKEYYWDSEDRTHLDDIGILQEEARSDEWLMVEGVFHLCPKCQEKIAKKEITVKFEKKEKEANDANA